MTKSPQVSVIILNRDRIAEPGRVLKALRFQHYRNFEVVVVSNQSQLLARHYPLIARAKVVEFSPANISAARNAGIAEASGEIIAFCDDDSVPEPTWLSRLIAPFSDETVGAVGGLVIGKNGVGPQWGLIGVDTHGVDHQMPEPQAVRVFPPKQPNAIKTAGTNCAFRRSALEDVGLFDEGFHFYLDEADLNLRLNRSKWATAYVPDARVSHTFAPSAIRSVNRAPKDLSQLGASLSLFLQKHAGGAPKNEIEKRFENAQRKRLINYMHLGLLEPRYVHPLLQTLRDGFEEGSKRVSRIPSAGNKQPPFVQFSNGDAAERVFLKARLFTRRSVIKKAKSLSELGAAVTIIEVLPSARSLTRRFTDDGYWHHRVGQFGRFERNLPRPLFRWNFQTAQLELEKIQRFR